MSYFIWGLAVWALFNLLTYWSFKVDKNLAVQGEWRIPEATLLAQAFIGGSLGAKVAQRRFRHKTRKEPFRTNLNAICVLHVIMILAGLVWLFGYWPAIIAWAP